MKKLLEGKNAIVTGTARGIGHKIVEVFAMHGANVWACARKQTDEFEAYCKSLSEQYGVIVEPVYFELTDKEQVQQAVKQIRGAQRQIDILVNNAGITYNALFQMSNEEQIHRTLGINFVAPYLFSQYIIKLMLRTGGGNVVNIASSAALDGNSGRSIYGASKAAVVCATKAMAEELGAKNIRANSFRPCRQARQSDPFPGDRVYGIQHRAVQCKTSRVFLRPFRSVQEVSPHRTADVAQVHPDLVSPSRLQFQQDQRAAILFPQDPVLRPGGFSFRADRPLHGRAGHLHDGKVQDAFLLFRYPVRQGQIPPPESRRVQLPLHQVLRMRRPGDNHQPAGPLVQPVHRPVDKVFRAAGPGEHRVLQRILRMVAARLAGDPCWFDRDHQVLVLPRHVDLQRIGLQLIDRFVLGPLDAHEITRRDQGICPDRLPVQSEPAVPFGALHGRIADPHAPPQDIPDLSPVFFFLNLILHQS